MTRYRFLIMTLAMGMLACGGSSAEELNPDLFPAFRRLENYALVYVEKQDVRRAEYEFCQTVVEIFKSRTRFDSAEDYYYELKRLGAYLPPLRLPNPPTAKHVRRAAAEHEELKRIQSQIVEQQLQNSLLRTKNEIDRLYNQR